MMKTLMYLGYIDEATILHELIVKLMVAKYESELLLSVEQERMLNEMPSIKDVF